MLKPVNIMWPIQQPNTRKVDGNYIFTSIQQLYIYIQGALKQFLIAP